MLADPTDRRRLTRILSVGLAVLAVSLIRTAWVSDDAYITFRTVDNVLNGYGLVWNVGERVQSFTHPLWLALFTPAYAITGEPYFTAMALGAACTFAAVLVMARRLAVTPWHLIPCFAALLSSKAFIDYSTSGLENPLTHLLLVVFLWRWWEEPPGERRLGRLSFVASLCLLNRMDLAPLIGPAVAVEAWRAGPRRAIGPVLVGMSLFLAWELYSLVYYGSLVPNTAYAKLGTGFPASWSYAHGLAYVRRTLVADPVTLPLIALSALAILHRWRRDWPLVAGVLLLVAYVVRIGGDFMMGRFFAAPFVWSVTLLARAPWAGSRRPALAVGAAVVALGLAAQWEPALLSGYAYSRLNNLAHGDSSAEPRDKLAYVRVDDVTDERRFYELSALLRQQPGQLRPYPRAAEEGLAMRAAVPPVVVFGYVGYRGYFAGPGVHIIDSFGLADPLLARLPARADSYPGHYQRDVPEGYVETIATGANHLADPDLADYYERVRVVISGPIWSRDRLTTIGALALGWYDDRLERYTRRRRAAPAD